MISDPINGISNPKSIPGASIGYCIQIENEANVVDATTIEVINDLSPFPVTFVPGSIRVNASATANYCDFTAGIAGGSYDGTSVSWIFKGLQEIQSTAPYFDVTVD